MKTRFTKGLFAAMAATALFAFAGCSEDSTAPIPKPHASTAASCTPPCTSCCGTCTCGTPIPTPQTTYTLTGEYPHLVGNGPPEYRYSGFGVAKTVDGVTTQLTPIIRVVDYNGMPSYNGYYAVAVESGGLCLDGNGAVAYWLSNPDETYNYYTFTVEVTADGQTWRTMGLLERTLGVFWDTWPPSDGIGPLPEVF